MLWYNQVTYELGSLPPWGTSYLDPEHASATYPDWIQVSDDFIPNIPTPPMTDEQVRMDRDRLIAETDWMVIRHRDQVDVGEPTTLTHDEYVELLKYRQALRELPNSIDYDPATVVFPAKPSFLVQEV